MIFFFKQKTAYEMRISDWSSDVCSSDLPHLCPELRWQMRQFGLHDDLGQGAEIAAAEFLRKRQSIETEIQQLAIDVGIDLAGLMKLRIVRKQRTDEIAGHGLDLGDIRRQIEIHALPPLAPRRLCSKRGGRACLLVSCAAGWHAAGVTGLA